MKDTKIIGKKMNTLFGLLVVLVSVSNVNAFPQRQRGSSVVSNVDFGVGAGSLGPSLPPAPPPSRSPPSPSRSQPPPPSPSRSPPPAPPMGFIPSAQFHSQNELGAYNYGFISGDGQARNEIRSDDGTVEGVYTYLDPNGLPIQVRYSAGPLGFQATGLHLPQPVPLPEANLRALADHMAAKAVVAAKEATKLAKETAAAAAVRPSTATLDSQQSIPYDSASRIQVIPAWS